MKFHYDNKVDALYIRFNNQRYKDSDEIAEGIIFDYDNAGKIVGIEVLDASKKFPKGFRSKLKNKDISISFA